MEGRAGDGVGEEWEPSAVLGLNDGVDEARTTSGVGLSSGLAGLGGNMILPLSSLSSSSSLSLSRSCSCEDPARATGETGEPSLCGKLGPGWSPSSRS